MKHHRLKISGILLIVVLTPPLFAQQPEIPVVVYKQPLQKTEFLLKKEFKSHDSLRGWMPLNHIGAFEMTDRNTLYLESNGNDPYFQSPLFPGGFSGKIRMTLRMKSNMGTSAQFFLTTRKYRNWNEKAGLSPMFDLTEDRNFHDYTVCVPLEEDDELLRMRIDPGTSVGTAEIESILLEREIDYPLELVSGKLTSDGQENRLEIIVKNHSEGNKKVIAEVSGPFPSKKPMIQAFLPETQTAHQITWENTEPFVFCVLRLYYEQEQQCLQRIFCTAAADLQLNGPKIGKDSLSIQFDKHFSGAVIRRQEQDIGVIFPLAYYDDALPVTLLSETPEQEEHLSGMPVFKVESQRSDQVKLTAEECSLQWTVSGNDEIRFEFHGTHAAHGPVFRPFGSLEQGLLSGVEYLGKGETSSSTADIETAEHLRYSPSPLDVTMPLTVFVTEKCSFAMLWDDPKTNVIFATPDFLTNVTGDSPHRMNLFGKSFAGTLRAEEGFGKPHGRLEDAILWAVQKRGLPDLPKPPRSSAEQHRLNRKGLTDSLAYVEGKGWRHAAIPGAAQSFPPGNFSDMISAVWQLTGKVPEFDGPLVLHGAHLPNDCVYFVTGQAERWLAMMNAQAAAVRAEQQPDGSFRYTGKYLKGHYEDTASGYCGHKTSLLLRHYRLTGNKDSLHAALKTLEYIKRFRVPRGAQTWELSLHTPDIMASGWCAMAYTWAFEATGQTESLDEARRWALTGLPFVYQWSHYPVMLYATTPVFGATDWSAPNWIGLPVQWCGLHYGEALFELAKHDQTLDWQKIAEGILISAEQQQYPDGESVGLLPDSFTLKHQRRHPADINPVVLEMQRRRLEGNAPALVSVVSENHRVLSPYPVTLQGDTAVIEAEKGVTYQILDNGQTIKTILSEGRDVIEL
ncbi:MAG: hypothetical protein LBQ54_01430 [Planctomycetaceae bacterium]|nr:hypothetical protein [Planctomycetaceae bacterium]